MVEDKNYVELIRDYPGIDRSLSKALYPFVGEVMCKETQKIAQSAVIAQLNEDGFFEAVSEVDIEISFDFEARTLIIHGLPKA